MKSFFRTLLSLSVVHWLTSAGVVVTTASAIAFVILLFQRVDNPYFGIVLFFILPALFVAGLILMPAGLFLASRRPGGMRRVVEEGRLDGARLSRFAWAFAFATLANVAILTLAAYRGVEHMDSAEFCGVTCHSVMQPQYVRFQKSPHAKVACVECHVGSGASSFVRYKLAGARQLVRLTTNTYARPIPPAMSHLRPANETCEHCHARESGEDKLKIIRHFDSDERSTPKITVLLMRVGSRIHKTHFERDIEYVYSDAAMQEIPLVRSGGKSFAVAGAAATGATRKMDCMDCHNRSGHDFETPEAAVDRAIAGGLLDRSRPFTRRDAVAALQQPSGGDIQPQPVRALADENVFSNMNIGWGAYPNNSGHERFPGCFRCHDGEHVTADGESISQDCSGCHELLAVEEESPAILKDLGLQ